MNPDKQLDEITEHIKTMDKEKSEYLKTIPKTKGYVLRLYIETKLLKGYSPIVLITGHTRGGKTCTALKIAEDVQPDFNFEKQYFYKIKDFVMNLNKLEGKVVIIDEVGYQLSSLTWWSNLNKIMNYILQTQGLRNVCYIFCLPHLEYLAKHIRRMIDVVCEMKDKGIMSVYFVQTIYSKLDGRKTYLYNIETLVNIPLPKCYKEFKDYEKQFKSDILKDLQQDILMDEAEQKYKKQKRDEDFLLSGISVEKINDIDILLKDSD